MGLYHCFLLGGSGWDGDNVSYLSERAGVSVVWRISRSIRNWGFERILLSHASLRYVTIKKEIHLFFCLLFCQQNPIFRPLAYNPASLTTGSWHSSQEFLEPLMVCDQVEGRMYCLSPLLAIQTFEGRAIFRKFQYSIVQWSGHEIADPWHCCEQKKFLVPASRQCDYRARDQIGDPRWMPPRMWVKFICTCLHLYLWACPLHLKMTCLVFTLGAGRRANHSLARAFVVQCLTQPDGRQASRAVFGSWLSDALHMTSGVAGQKTGLPLLVTWRYPSSSPFSTGKELASFVGVFGFWRGFQLVFRWTCFRDFACKV